MIVVRVELWSARDGQRTELARMHICNVGSTFDLRDYDVTTLRGRSTADLDRGTAQRRGAVKGHPSPRLHVWHLVGRALAALGYAPLRRGTLHIVDAPEDGTHDERDRAGFVAERDARLRPAMDRKPAAFAGQGWRPREVPLRL